MNRYRDIPPPRRWRPKLKEWIYWLTQRIWRPKVRRSHKLSGVDIENWEVVRQAIDDGAGVLIAPNHSTHADPYSAHEASLPVGVPFYFMATWHVFDENNWIQRWFLQRNGVFSVDRDGTDREAVKTAVDILRNRPNPLVIFPEGEVYHCNDIITPFRQGPASIALIAASRADRPIVCIPCGMKYHYTEDPTPELLELMNRLERANTWWPRPEMDLVSRIYALGEALMAMKELEFLGKIRQGPLTERTVFLAETILGRQEEREGICGAGKMIPERVKELRKRAIVAPASERRDRDLEELFLVVQLYSYPGDYVLGSPKIERIAETLDKLEEDILRVHSATPRGKRHATIRFGEPIPVPKDRSKNATVELTAEMERGVQAMLDEIGESKFEL